jgi:hypothetical protein
MTPADGNERRSVLKLLGHGALGALGTFGVSGTGTSVARTADDGDGSADSDLSGPTVTVDWRRTYTTSDGTDVVGIHDVQRGGGRTYVAGGGAGRPDELGLNGDRLWLLRTDESGERCWDRTYSADGRTTPFRGMDVAPTGERYALVGGQGDVNRVGEPHEEDPFGHLVVAGPNGEVMWERTSDGEAYGDVVALPDGVVVGGGTPDPEGDSDTLALVRKYDWDGNVRWSRRSSSDGGIPYVGVTHVVASGDGSVGALSFAGLGTGRNHRVAEFSADGEMRWKTSDTGFYENVEDIVPLDDGEYVLGGHVFMALEARVSRITPEGALLWTETYDESGEGTYTDSRFSVEALTPVAGDRIVGITDYNRRLFSVDGSDGSLVFWRPSGLPSADVVPAHGDGNETELLFGGTDSSYASYAGYTPDPLASLAAVTVSRAPAGPGGTD